MSLTRSDCLPAAFCALMILVHVPVLAATPTGAVIASFQFPDADIVGLSAGSDGEVAVYDQTPGANGSLLRFLQASVVNNKIQIVEAPQTLTLTGNPPGFKGWMLRDGDLLYALARRSATNSGRMHWEQMWLYVIDNHTVLNAINYNGTDQVNGDQPLAAPEDYRYAVNGFTLKPSGSEGGNNVRLIIDDTLKGNLDILDLDASGSNLVEQQRYSYRNRLEDGCQWPDTDPGPDYVCNWHSIAGNGLALDWAFETRTPPSDPDLFDRDEIYLLDPLTSQAHVQPISLAQPGAAFWAQKEPVIELANFDPLLANGVESLESATRLDQLWVASGMQSFDKGFVTRIDMLHRTGQVIDPVYGDQNILLRDAADPEHWFIPVANGFIAPSSLMIREIKQGKVVNSITALNDYDAFGYSLDAATYDTRYGLVYLAIDDTVYVVPVSAPGLNDSDGDGIPNHLDPDDDNDGIPDEWEHDHKLDPLNPADAGLDSDGDTYSNFTEYLAQSNPWDDTSRPTGSCGEDTVVIENLVYPNEEIPPCQGGRLIIAGPGVTVSGGASLTYSAPWVILQPDFRVIKGGIVHIQQ